MTKGKMDYKSSRDSIFWFFLVLFLISIYFISILFWPFISVIILGAVVSGIFKPVYNFIKKGTRPSFASFLTCTLIFFLLFVPMVFFGSALSQEAYDLYLTAKSAVLNDQIKHFLTDNRTLERINILLSRFNFELSANDLNKAIAEAAKITGFFLYEQIRAIASNMAGVAINFCFMLLVIYYLLIDGDELLAFIIDLSPLPNEQDEQLISKFKDMSGAILIGNGFGGLIQGLLGGALFALFGLKSPFLWGVIMGLLAFLPILGIGIVFIPAAGILFLNGRIGAGIFFIIFYLLLSGGIEYLFKPRLVGKRVKIHTLLVFMAIIGGLQLFGILGIIYGPLVVTAFLTLTDIYRTNYQKMVEFGEQEAVSLKTRTKY